MESFILLLSLAATLNLSEKFFDVKIAYLYSDLQETVFMKPPPGYGKECKVNNRRRKGM